MNWIFKIGDYFQMDSNNKKAFVTMEQKRNFTGKEGQTVPEMNDEWIDTISIISTIFILSAVKR